MKFNRVFGLLAAILPALAVPVHDNSTPYVDVKVLRIPTGNTTVPLDSLVSEFDLRRWTSVSRPNSHVDVEVPKAKFTAFTSAAKAILSQQGVSYPIEMMHEDLAASIRKETESMVFSTESEKVAAGKHK